jgi:hypothetical protein
LRPFKWLGSLCNMSCMSYGMIYYAKPCIYCTYIYQSYI